MPNNNKFVRNNTNGTHVLNIISHQPILKSNAINMATASGMLKIYDVRTLYDWFIKHNNNELRGYISHLTRAQRKRIIKLYNISKKLRTEQIALEQKSRIKGTSLYNNSSLYMLKIFRVLISFFILFIALYLFSSLLTRVQSIMHGTRPVSMRNVLATGSTGMLYGAAFIGSLVFTMKGYDFILDRFMHHKITELQQHLEKYIDDGIPELTWSNIRTLQSLIDIRNTHHNKNKFGILASPTWHQRYGNKITRLEDKFTNLGLL
jgi:hypothetical protein